MYLQNWFLLIKKEKYSQKRLSKFMNDHKIVQISFIPDQSLKSKTGGYKMMKLFSNKWRSVI